MHAELQIFELVLFFSTPEVYYTNSNVLCWVVCGWFLLIRLSYRGAAVSDPLLYAMPRETVGITRNSSVYRGIYFFNLVGIYQRLLFSSLV